MFPVVLDIVIFVKMLVFIGELLVGCSWLSRVGLEPPTAWSGSSRFTTAVSPLNLILKLLDALTQYPKVAGEKSANGGI